MKKKIDSKEAGLAIGLIFGKYFFKTDDLHYGYWTPDLKVCMENMPKAQSQHSDLIISNIPEGVKTILDVGCGAGNLARKLTDKGYKVDCVSPGTVLTQNAKKLLKDESEIFETVYENVSTDKKYDLVVFSESFQYIDLKKAFEQTLRFLNPGGYMLICDFFQTDAPGESALGGGHKLKEFYGLVSGYPFKKLNDIDITKETSPNLDLIYDMSKNVLLPIRCVLFDFLDSRHKIISKFIKWKFRKKIEKMDYKYFSGARNGKNFEIFKSYRLMLFKNEGGNV